jgi:hypothetical protein
MVDEREQISQISRGLFFAALLRIPDLSGTLDHVHPLSQRYADEFDRTKRRAIVMFDLFIKDTTDLHKNLLRFTSSQSKLPDAEWIAPLINKVAGYFDFFIRDPNGIGSYRLTKQQGVFLPTVDFPGLEEICKEARAEGLALQESERERRHTELKERQSKIDVFNREREGVEREYNPVKTELEALVKKLDKIETAEQRILKLESKLQPLKNDMQAEQKYVDEISELGWLGRRKLQMSKENIKKVAEEKQEKITSLKKEEQDIVEKILEAEEICDQYTPSERVAMKFRRKALEAQQQEFQGRLSEIDNKIFELQHGSQPVNPFSKSS